VGVGVGVGVGSGVGPSSPPQEVIITMVLKQAIASNQIFWNIFFAFISLKFTLSEGKYNEKNGNITLAIKKKLTVHCTSVHLEMEKAKSKE
jgi:hypothetical protein